MTSGTTQRRLTPARYLAAGAVCAVAQNALVIGGDLQGYNYLVTVSVSTVLVGALGYILHACFTYGERLSWDAFLRFMAGLTSGYLLSLATFAVLHDLLFVPIPIASPITTAVTTVWNFVATRWAIRRPTTSRIPH